MEEELFFFETFTADFFRHLKVDKIYYQGKTEYQLVQLFHNRIFGKILFLDGKIQSAQIDEFIFHESLVHPALMTHVAPRKVLIVGGGEGATLREVLRHASVERAVMVDIDKKLVELCQEHMPEWSEGAFSDTRTQLIFGDARQYIERTQQKFDVIISDLTEPVKGGPSVYLFTTDFFGEIFKALNEDGLFVLQAGGTDPFYNQFFASCARTLEETFPLVRPYWTFIFSFNNPWGFILASKKTDPLEQDEKVISERMRSRGIEELKFYHPGFHHSLFSLPVYLMKALKKGRVLTDKNPFIWEA